MANTNTSYIKDPINGITYEKDLHLFDTEKVVHSKDDVKGIKRGLRKLNYKITGSHQCAYSGHGCRYHQGGDDPYPRALQERGYQEQNDPPSTRRIKLLRLPRGERKGGAHRH